jgi:alkylation response protein AidB-like acyl-CoA dehydrogenase
MDLFFTPEHDQLRAATRDLLERHAPEAAVRVAMETEAGFDPETWHRMAQIGLQGLLVPEVYDGAGAGFVELGIVMEELGRALYCGPFLSSALLGCCALLQAGDEAVSSRYLPGLCAGTSVATIADDGLLAGNLSGIAPGQGATVPTATSAASGTKIDGQAAFVLDGHVADLFIVTATDGDRAGLYLVEAASAHVKAAPLPTMDATRKIATVEFRGAAARCLASGENADRIRRRVLDLALIALAAEQVGGAQHMMDVAVAYAGTRVQFGRTIGSFQAVKHMCADMSVTVEAARSAAYNGMWTAAGDAADRELAIAAAIAHSYCSEAFTQVTAASIQVLGGIGFTWEHPAHLYYRRAKSAELLFGSPAAHRRHLARLLGLRATLPADEPTSVTPR